MKSIYLVQRMKRTGSDPDGGVDANFHLDYMGSAEFEFGALPTSLKRITSELIQYKEIKSNCDTLTNGKDEPLRIFIRQGELDHGYIEDLEKLAKSDAYVHTKERVKLDKAMTGDFNDHLDRVDVWWDIENDVFFYFGKQNGKVLRQSLENVKEKFLSQNKI